MKKRIHTTPIVGYYIYYTASMDVGMETFFDSFYGKVIKIIDDSIEVELIHFDQKETRKKALIPLSYCAPGGYREVVEEGLSSLSQKSNTYRAEILSSLKMKQIIERKIYYSTTDKKLIKEAKNNVTRLQNILAKIILPTCIKHSYKLINEEVDKWWVNYYFLCTQCGAKKIQKGAV